MLACFAVAAVPLVEALPLLSLVLLQHGVMLLHQLLEGSWGLLARALSNLLVLLLQSMRQGRLLMLALLAMGHAQLQGCELVGRQRLLLHGG